MAHLSIAHPPAQSPPAFRSHRVWTMTCSWKEGLPGSEAPWVTRQQKAQLARFTHPKKASKRCPKGGNETCCPADDTCECTAKRCVVQNIGNKKQDMGHHLARIQHGVEMLSLSLAAVVHYGGTGAASCRTSVLRTSSLRGSTYSVLGRKSYIIFREPFPASQADIKHPNISRSALSDYPLPLIHRN